MRFIGWLLCACLVTASSGCDFGGGGDQLQVEVDSDQLSDQAEGHLLEFTSRFGSRPAASEQERAAAEYLRAALEESGYQTELQAFTVQLLPDRRDQGRHDLRTARRPRGGSSLGDPRERDRRSNRGHPTERRAAG
jgi:hypothetical protein